MKSSVIFWNRCRLIEEEISWQMKTVIKQEVRTFREGSNSVESSTYLIGRLLRVSLKWT